MDALDYGKAVLRRWPLVVTLALVFSVGALLMAMSTPRTYGAYTAFFVTTSAPAGTTSLQDSNTFVQARMKSYAQLVKTPQVLGPVMKAARVDLDMSDVADGITVDAPLDTVILGVKVTQENPRDALALTKAMASLLPTSLERLEAASGSKSPLRVTVVTPPSLGPEPESPRPKRMVVIGATLGTIAGVLGAVLLQLRERTLRSPGPHRAEGAGAAGEKPGEPHHSPKLPWTVGENKLRQKASRSQ